MKTTRKLPTGITVGHVTIISSVKYCSEECPFCSDATPVKFACTLFGRGYTATPLCEVPNGEGAMEIQRLPECIEAEEIFKLNLEPNKEVFNAAMKKWQSRLPAHIRMEVKK